MGKVKRRGLRPLKRRGLRPLKRKTAAIGPSMLFSVSRFTFHASGRRPLASTLFSVSRFTFDQRAAAGRSLMAAR
jgi:hypothetical protein